MLVIEAGPFDLGQDGILVPGAYAPYLYFWPNLVTAPQAGLNNRSIATVAAQVVGGGSTINAMVYLRCVWIPELSRPLTIPALEKGKSPGANGYNVGVMLRTTIHGVLSVIRAGAGKAFSPISRR